MDVVVDCRLHDGILLNMMEHIITHFKERVYSLSCPQLDVIHI